MFHYIISRIKEKRNKEDFMQLPKTPRGQKFKEKKCQYPGTFSIAPLMKSNIEFSEINLEVGDDEEKLKEEKR